MKKFKILIPFFLLVVINCSAQQVGERPGYNFYPAIQSGKYGFINSTGQWMINPKYEWCSNFYDGRAVAKEKGKFGFIDIKGNWVGKPVYDTVSNFSEGLAAIAQRNEEGKLNWSFIDTSGKAISIKVPALSALSSFSCSRSIGSESEFLNFFFFNRRGEIAFEAKDFFLDENRIAEFSENFLHVYVGDDGKSTFIDTAGLLWGKGVFENCGDFHEGLAWFFENGKYGFVNILGEKMIPALYDSVGNFSEGIAMVKSGMKYNQENLKMEGGLVGYIDKEGKKITPFIYSSGSAFSDGFAFVKYNGKFGFIDKEGKVVIDYQFEDGSNFFRGLAYVKLENHWEYINTNGKKIF